MDFRSRIVRYERVPANLLRAHPRQPWTHPEGQRGDVQENLRRRGQVLPLCVTQDGNGKGYVIVDGHLRADIAGDCEVDVAVTDLSPEEAEAELVALNRTANLVESDDALLASLLQQVNEESGLAGTGYDDALLAALVAQTQGNGDPLEDPGPGEPPKDPVTRPGDVWIMRSAQGMEHRLVCGDCREFGTWEKLLGDERVNVVFTSPPYAEQRKEQYGGVPASEYVEWFRAVADNVRACLADDGSFFVNLKAHCEAGERETYDKRLVLAMREWGWRFVDEFCWRRPGLPGAWDTRFKNEWEPVFHFSQVAACACFPQQVSETTDVTPRNVKGTVATGSGFQSGRIGSPDGVARPGNVVDTATVGEAIPHPAMFPFALAEWFVRAFTRQGDLVADCFIGSGTVIVAAEKTGRRGAGIEVMPAYCDVAVRRWMTATHNPAILEATGAEFPIPQEAVI